MDNREDIDTQKKLYNFFQKYPIHAYKKGGILIRAGEKSSAHYITEGTVSQYDIGSNGDKLVLNIYKQGAFISLGNILNDLRSDLFFEATNQVVVHTAPSSDVIDFLKKNPDVVYDALTRVSRGGNGLMLRLASAMRGQAEDRILQELTIMKARFSGDDGVIKINDTELAAQTGLARETVSRTLKRLRADGRISSDHGKIILHDLH